MAAFERISSGIPEMNQALDNIRLGDNVVWRVDRLSTFQLFVEPYVKQAIQDGRNVIYVRFASHEPLVEEQNGVTVVRMELSHRFETFTVEIHHLIEQEGKVLQKGDDMELSHGRPENIMDRLEKEVRVYDLLDQLSIDYERIDHEPANTMEACKEIDQILAPAVICKNLFLCNSKQTKFYLLMIREDKMFRTKEISRQINSTRLSFASAEKMQEYLDITPGSVSVMGLMNDKNLQVQLLVDEDVLHSEYFGCHPCVNTASLRVKTKDVFERFLNAVNHDYITVQVPIGI